ncbi:MAG: hypothetical protein V3R89_05975, partial [Thermoanaerobaculia bacterium]
DPKTSGLQVASLQETSNSPLAPWELRPAARILVGRFLPDHADLLLVQDDSGLLLLAFTRRSPEKAPTIGFYPVLRMPDNVGVWSFSGDDAMIAADFDADPENEVLVRKGNLLGVLDFHPVPRAVFVTRLNTATLVIEAAPVFLRGDVDKSARVDLSDAVSLLKFLFLEKLVLYCEDAADIDDSGEIGLSDPINLLQFLFSGGPPPAPPGPHRAGIDPTVDALGCGA